MQRKKAHENKISKCVEKRGRAIGGVKGENTRARRYRGVGGNECGSDDPGGVKGNAGRKGVLMSLRREERSSRQGSRCRKELKEE